MKCRHCLILIAVMLVGCAKSSQSSTQPIITLTTAPEKQEKVTPKEDSGKKPSLKGVLLTPGAAAEVRKLMQESGGRYLRITVTDDYHHKLDLDTEMDPKDDFLWESRGVQVVVDRKSARFLPAGTTVDFGEKDGKIGFKISHPENDQDPPDTSVSLVEARRGFKTVLARQQSGGKPVPDPPPDVFRTVRYPAPPGNLVAYLTPDPKDGKKHPAIVWITGGDCNSIGAGCWREAPRSNDQSASAYRKVGIVMMFPALRGGNDNPGIKEGFLGEVDDVLAAAEFLRKQPFVDHDRIYLGGHSTGGTLVLLTSECTDRFRAVFSFGPIDDVMGYGLGYNPFDLSNRKEIQLRAPGRWLHSIRVPVFVFEGTEGGNLSALQAMSRSSKNPKVRFFPVKGANHFDLLFPTNRLIAEKILRDTGPTCNLMFTEEEVNKPFVK